MKLITNLLQRIQNRSAKQKNKRGASLALVMIAGTLLVIWVMCILPLMTTTGVAAYGTQDNMLAYLQNRSGIEYCKSELKFMVSESDYLGMPHSFAVVKENGKFVAYDVYQESGMYNSLVKSDFTPASSEVIAICEVEDLENKHHITITTWSNGKRGLTYTATYTGGGTLKILPESYRGNEALPLNDFVLVDGKLGSRKIWNSGINLSHVNSDSLNFEEHLLGLILGDNLDSEYANAFQYPAVFKTTAHTTLAEGSSIAEEVTMGDLTSDMEWYYPQTENTSLNGGVYVNNSNQITVTTPERNDLNIHKNVTFLYNGSANKPANGSYATTVHYPGTGASADGTNKYTEGGTNVLPFSGFEFQKFPVYGADINGDANVVRGNYTIINFAAEEQDDPNAAKTFTLTIARADMSNGERQPNEEGLKYGYVINNDVDHPIWQDTAEFTGLKFQDDKGKNQSYFFFVYKPASYENGTFHSASALKSAGMVFKPETHSGDLQNGDYAIAAIEGNTYYFLKDDLSGIATSVAGDTYGFLGGDALDGVTWTYSKSGRWNPTQSLEGSKGYLDFTATFEGIFNIKENQRHQHSRRQTGNCLKQEYEGYTFKEGNLSNNSRATSLNIERVSGDTFRIYKKDVSGSVSYKPFPECRVNYNNNNREQTKSFRVNLYLDLAGTDSLVSLGENNQIPTVKFIKIPTVPNASQIRLDSRTHTLASVAYRPGGIPLSEIITTNYGVVKQVYINGEKINGTAAILNAGYYNVVIENDLGWVNAGYLTVTRASYTDNALTITATRTFIETEPDDDVLVDTNEKTDYFGIEVKASGFNPEGGFRYFGYREEGSRDEFRWYPATTDSFTFRLNYGEYEFAVMETGSYNYVRRSQGGATCEIPVPQINLVVGQSERLFMFMMENNKPVWYRLPDGVYPDMVKMWYGYTKDGEATGSIDWQTTYQGKTWSSGLFGSNKKYLATYAVQVDYSNYPKSSSTSSKKFDISLRGELDSPYLNNHGDSMLRGNSMYFMGTPSIDTHGCKVMLTTDLLVLNAPFESSDADGEGQIIVKKYDTSTGKPKEVLVFVPHDNDNEIVISNSQGIPLFEEGQFYQILGSDVGVDLLSLDPDDVKHVGDANNADVKKWFSTGVYPDLNLDICYASNEQLARIVSSETFGWTNNGVLHGSDPVFNESDPDFKNSNPDYNEKYVITTYVTSVESGNHCYAANRILMAAGKESSYVLNVPQNMYTITRYLSIDADNINGSGKFIVYNLGQVDDYVSKISEDSGLTKTYSRTLQVDFERKTFINDVAYSKQISRYEHGTDLFGDLSPESVIVTYADKELENLMPSEGLAILSRTLKTVDRYVSIVPAGEDKGAISISSTFNVKLKVYANYVYFDERIESINISALDILTDSADVYFGAQETGYTTTEYLGLFTRHTADSYVGTIIYIGNPDGLEVQYDGRTEVVIPQGIYRVQNDTRLSDFGNSKNLSYDGSTKIEIILNFADKTTNPERYQAGIKKLGNLSVYIDPKDGIYDETFVETGLDVNAFGGAAGFSGGTVE